MDPSGSWIVPIAQIVSVIGQTNKEIKLLDLKNKTELVSGSVEQTEQFALSFV